MRRGPPALRRLLELGEGGGRTRQLHLQLLGQRVVLGLELTCRQTDAEGEMIGWVHQAVDAGAAVVLNPAGWTHTSVALRDAMSAVTVPRVEVHISDIAAREAFRHHSYLTDVTDHQVIGRGVPGYVEAIHWVVARRHR